MVPLVIPLPVAGLTTLAMTLTFEPQLMVRSGMDMVSRVDFDAAATAVMAGASSAAGAAESACVATSWPAQRQRPSAVDSAVLPVRAGSRRRRPERSSRTV